MNAQDPRCELVHDFDIEACMYICHGRGLGVEVTAAKRTADDAIRACYTLWCLEVEKKEEAEAAEARLPKVGLGLMVAALRPNGISPLWRK